MFGDILESKDAHVATATALLRWPKKDKKLPSSHSVACSWNSAIWQPLDFSIQFGVDQRDVHQDLRFYSSRDRWIFSPHNHRKYGWTVRRKNLLCMVWWGLIPWVSVIFLPIHLSQPFSVCKDCKLSFLWVVSDFSTSATVYATLWFLGLDHCAFCPYNMRTWLKLCPVVQSLPSEWLFWIIWMPPT